MKLSELLQGIQHHTNAADDLEILGIAYDSRSVKPGDAFFCIKGYQTDGHAYAKSAQDQGAVVAICEHELDLQIPCVVVEDARKAMALAAANYFGHPQDGMKILGITGTNGKTTTTYMLKTVLDAMGKKAGLIGTVCCMAGEKILKESDSTTPEPMQLFGLLRRMKDEGCEYVCMEVSSHGLSQDRVLGIEFEVGIFSNLTQDHLDYHKSMQEYAAQKRKLFLQSKIGVFNLDDPHCSDMTKGVGCRQVFYGTQPGADLCAQNIQLHQEGISYDLEIGGKRYPVQVNIPGKFTVYNSMACITALYAMGMRIEDILEGLQKIQGVPGRIEVVPTPGREYTVILDYAHTPDSMENILAAVAGFCKGRIITVFGCGGDRDPLKRPLMGEAAGKASNFCVVTSDNPRTEDPQKILADIIPGVEKSGCEYTVIENRREAIRFAMTHAEKDDVIVLAGKGHEPYQDIMGVKHPFDEKVIVKEILQELDSRRK